MTFDFTKGSTNGWVEFKIPVSSLKTAVQNKAGANYILFALAGNPGTPIYVYSIEITD